MSFSKQTERLKVWFNKYADSKKSAWILGVISFTESSFFPIPPDPFLMAVLLVKENKWIKYSAIVTIASVLGAIFGYFVGLFFNEFVVDVFIKAYGLQDEFIKVATYFDRNNFWTMFIAAFTPIPFKVFTISAGLFKVNLFVFIIASLIGRGLRFFIVGFLMKMFGRRMVEIMVKYLNIITYTAVVIAIIYLLFKFL